MAGPGNLGGKSISKFLSLKTSLNAHRQRCIPIDVDTSSSSIASKQNIQYANKSVLDQCPYCKMANSRTPAWQGSLPSDGAQKENICSKRKLSRNSLRGHLADPAYIQTCV
jgi:hypothetical protein